MKWLKPRIVWGDYAGKVVDGRELTTYDSYTMSVQADDVYLDCLTVENDAGRVGQAVALETRGDRIHLYHCALIGDQDTFFARGYVSRVHVENCYIEGTTDFIFGPSIVLFECSTIHCKADSFITAASTTERNEYGFVFSCCRVTAADFPRRSVPRGGATGGCPGPMRSCRRWFSAGGS